MDIVCKTRAISAAQSMPQGPCDRGFARLFTLLPERYERKSIVIATNLVFSEWERILKDLMTTLAAIDRVVHHSVVLDMMGVEGYRAKAAGAKPTASAPVAA